MLAVAEPAEIVETRSVPIVDIVRFAFVTITVPIVALIDRNEAILPFPAICTVEAEIFVARSVPPIVADPDDIVALIMEPAVRVPMLAVVISAFADVSPVNTFNVAVDIFVETKVLMVLAGALILVVTSNVPAVINTLDKFALEMRVEDIRVPMLAVPVPAEIVVNDNVPVVIDDDNI